MERGEGALEWDRAQQPGPTFIWVALMTSSQESEGVKDSSKNASLYFIVWIKSIGLNEKFVWTGGDIGGFGHFSKVVLEDFVPLLWFLSAVEKNQHLQEA